LSKGKTSEPERTGENNHRNPQTRHATRETQSNTNKSEAEQNLNEKFTKEDRCFERKRVSPIHL
jgi:hypothetical protein